MAFLQLILVFVTVAMLYLVLSGTNILNVPYIYQINNYIFQIRIYYIVNLFGNFFQLLYKNKFFTFYSRNY